MADQIWSWALTIVGATCFFLAGGLGARKVWWAWYVGLFAQALWLTYSLLDLEHRLGFLVGVALYGFVYVRNCVKWTREHRAEKRARARENTRPATWRRELLRATDFLPTTRVHLIQEDRYLREREGVTPGETVGLVVDWSRLSPDDFGVLVDWGSGYTIRAEVTELRPTTRGVTR